MLVRPFSMTSLLGNFGGSDAVGNNTAAFTTLPEFEKAVQTDENAKNWVPPGKLVHSYTTNQRNYEIWAGSLADPDIRALLDRAQIFVSFFIEAGTPLALDDPEWTLKRWTVYFV